MLEDAILEYCNKYNGISRPEILASVNVLKAVYSMRGGGLVFTEQEIKSTFNSLVQSGRIRVRQ